MEECESKKKKKKKKLEGSGCMFLRQMFQIPWKGKVTNNYCLQMVNESATLSGTIRNRQILFFDHTMRRVALEKIVPTGKISSRRARGGRQKLCYMVKDGGMEEYHKYN